MGKQDGKWKVFLLADLAAHQKIEWDLNTNTKTHSHNIFWFLNPKNLQLAILRLAI